MICQHSVSCFWCDMNNRIELKQDMLFMLLAAFDNKMKLVNEPLMGKLFIWSKSYAQLPKDVSLLDACNGYDMFLSSDGVFFAERDIGTTWLKICLNNECHECS